MIAELQCVWKENW